MLKKTHTLLPARFSEKLRIFLKGTALLGSASFTFILLDCGLLFFPVWGSRLFYLNIRCRSKWSESINCAL